MLMLQIPVHAPGLPGTPGKAAADSGSLTPQVGRAARKILSGPVQTLPDRILDWGQWAFASLEALLPRLLLAALVAAIVFAATAWLRTFVRDRRVDSSAQERSAESGIGVLGGIAAALLAAWIIGATGLGAALLTFGVFYALAVIITLVGARARRRAASPEAADLAVLVARYALILLGAVEGIDTLGVNLGGVIAGLGILGLAVGFAAQDTFANLISGFLILWDRSIRVGDWVSIKDVEGRVRRVTLRTTRVETRDRGILVIPNKDVTGTTLYNFSLRPLSRVRVAVGVAYDTDIARARRVLLSLVPLDDPVVRSEPEPFVAVTALGDNAVTMELIFSISDATMRVPLQWRVMEAVLLEFREQGIEIAFPQLDLHIRSPGTQPLRL